MRISPDFLSVYCRLLDLGGSSEHGKIGVFVLCLRDLELWRACGVLKYLLRKLWPMVSAENRAITTKGEVSALMGLIF